MGNADGCLKNSNRETPKRPLPIIIDEGNPLKEKQEPAQDNKDEKDTSMEQQFSPDGNLGDITVFPDEIILEILSWLPVKSLVKLKCLCKKFFSLIEDRQFIKKHISRASTSTFRNIYNTLKIAPDTTNPNPNPIPNRETLRFICGCDGLLVMKGNASNKYHIRNPTTQQKLDLPSPHEGSFGMALSFNSATGYYKLVSFFYDKERRDNERCEILTVGIDDSWRPLQLPNLLDEGTKRERISVVAAGDAVHCVRVLKVGAYIFGREVVSLDLNTECLTTTSIPENLFSDWGSVWALDWNGHLAFADRVEDDLNVSVLEDFKKHRWGERKRILRLAFTEEKKDVKDLVPLYYQCGNLWFLLKYRKLIRYNIESGKIIDTIFSTNGYNIVGNFYHYPPSLVSLKGMKPEK